MPANQNPVVSIVSIHLFMPEANIITATTKMNGVYFTTDYFSADNPEKPVGCSVGKKDGLYVETLYYHASDTEREHPIGVSVSAQDNSYSEVNYFNINDKNRERIIGRAVITHHVPHYTANYFAGNDIKRKNILATSETTRDIHWFTTTYDLKPKKDKNNDIELLELKSDYEKEYLQTLAGAGVKLNSEKNAALLFARKVSAQTNPEKNKPAPKNGKGKCCSIM